MKIIAIDPGTIVTGYAIIHLCGSVSTALDYGCIKPPSSMKITDRYLVIYNSLDELLEKHKPEVLVVETQFVNKNIQSAIKLGMARGISIIAAKRRGIQVYEYAPAKAKQAVVGNGRASKYQVKMMVQRLLDLQQPPEPEDAADALALALCHAHARQYGSEI